MKKTKTYIEITVGEKTERKYIDSKDCKIGEPESWREFYEELRSKAK